MRLTRREYFCFVYYSFLGQSFLDLRLLFVWLLTIQLGLCLRLFRNESVFDFFLQVQFLWKPWIYSFVQLCWNRTSLSIRGSDSSIFCTWIIFFTESIILSKGASMEGTLCIPFQSSRNG